MTATRLAASWRAIAVGALIYGSTFGPAPLGGGELLPTSSTDLRRHWTLRAHQVSAFGSAAPRLAGDNQEPRVLASSNHITQAT
uniref:Uncharacterized protein n=1 Tax=Chelativorans sp. (strain BNC1) TaxID=266779 RepID=Q11FA7_CHESB